MWVVNATPRPLYRQYLWYGMLGGPEGRPGQVRKISPPPGFDPRTVHPVASRYTDCLLCIGVITGFHRDVDEICVFLGCCATCSSKSYGRFGTNYRSHLQRSHLIPLALYPAQLRINFLPYFPIRGHDTHSIIRRNHTSVIFLRVLLLR
jgi:hypothetical protein